jgi:hypothetical protein
LVLAKNFHNRAFEEVANKCLSYANQLRLITKGDAKIYAFIDGDEAMDSNNQIRKQLFESARVFLLEGGCPYLLSSKVSEFTKLERKAFLGIACCMDERKHVVGQAKEDFISETLASAPTNRRFIVLGLGDYIPKIHDLVEVTDQDLIIDVSDLSNVSEEDDKNYSTVESILYILSMGLGYEAFRRYVTNNNEC